MADNNQKIDYRQLIRDEYKRCYESPVYFMRRYCKIEHSTRGAIPFDLFKFQENTLDSFKVNRFNIVLKSRQMGISTLVAGYSLWLMTFFDSKTILVIATTQATAKNLVTKVRFMHSNLPSWLKVENVEDNKLSLKLKNGSQVVAASSASDSARSYSASLLVMDECVDYFTKIKVKDLKFDREVVMNIGQMVKLNPNNYLVYTPNGWSTYTGVKQIKKDFYLTLNFDDGSNLICSDAHRLKMLNGEFKYARDIQVGEELHGINYEKTLTSKIQTDHPIELFDLENVELGNEYFTNNVVSHNCAFIEGAEDIWTAAQPTLSNGGGAILLSTPNGLGQFFHKMWVEAEQGLNGFNAIKLKWDLHPDRDQSWRDEMTKVLGTKESAQECDCDFLSSGSSVIDLELLEYYKRTFLSEPIEKRGYDKNLWVWAYPDYTKQYLVSADVARGDGEDFSAFHVIDIEGLEQVAEYRGKLTPKEYGNILISTATEFNNALLVIENASVGWAAIQQVLDRHYPNLFYSSSDLQYIDVEHQMTNRVYRDEKKLTPGFTTSSKTRPLIISKIDSYLRELTIRIHSIRLLEELYTFIWKNGRPEAMSGYNDDLVMSFGIGLWVRDTSFRLKTDSANIQRMMLERINTSTNIPEAVYMQNNTAQNPYHMDLGNGTTEDLTWLIK